MFTGIVEELGVVEALEDQGDAVRLTVRGPHVIADAALGDSISVNGCCLTVAERDGETFTADVMRETLDKTSLGALVPGARVNLERAVTADHPARRPHRPGPRRRHRHRRTRGSPSSTGRSSRSRCRAELSPLPRRQGLGHRRRHLADRGRRAGAETRSPSRLIPETLARTTLGFKQPGDPVNLEVDVIAKYVERLLAPPTHGPGRTTHEPRDHRSTTPT